MALSPRDDNGERAGTAEFCWTGAFADDGLEAEFRRDSLPALQRFLRVSIAVASIVFLAYGLHDAWLVPNVREQAWTVRYAVFVPVTLGASWLVRSRYLLRYGQIGMLGYAIAANFVVLYIGVIAGGSGYFLYTSYSVLFVTLGPFIPRLRVATQLVYTALTLVLFLVLDRLFGESAAPARWSIGASISSLGSIAAVLARQLEAQAREGFLQRRLIRDQVKALELEKARSEQLLLNVLPPSIAERLKLEERPIADGFAEVSVLFADIVGFTKMSARLTPGEIVDRLNLIFSSFDDLVDKLRLEKIKTIGDAYMVAGGLHSREYDHAKAIAEMALAMRRRAQDFGRDFGDALAIRIGIHTGPVVAGVIGKRKFTYDVWGDTVNTASRMESHSEPGQIQVSEATYRLLAATYDFTPRGEIEVKGKGTMRTWFLDGRRADGNPMAETQMPRKIDGTL